MTHHTVVIKKTGSEYRAKDTKCHQSEKITWELDKDLPAAHFQFPPRVFENDPDNPNPRDIYDPVHNTGRIESAETLTLLVRTSTGSHHYAIWIDNRWAIGHNPSPKVDVGG